MNQPDDLDLIRRLRHGDRRVRDEAFSALFGRHQRRAFDLAWRVLGDAGLAADVVQEAFLSVYRNGGGFRERAQFTSWLHRVVLNRSIDLRRRERRHRAHGLVGRSDAHDDGRGDGAEPESRLESPGAGVESAERAEAVRRAIDRLSPRLAEVVLLRYPRGMSYEEIGEVLGVPPGTVKSRLNRAHSALRRLLGPTLEGDGRAGPGTEEAGS